MADPFTLGIMAVGTAVAAKSAISAISSATSQAAATYAANNQTLVDHTREEIKQTKEANNSAQEAVSDRVRTANADMALASMMAAERGASQSTMTGILRQLSFAEGVDLSRIEKTRKSTIESIANDTKNAARATSQSNALAYNEAKSTAKSAKYGFLSSTLKIGTDYAQQRAVEKSAANKTPTR